jgi:SulP family sulfate permease
MPIFKPKLVTVLREGYDAGSFRRDAVAGITVAIVALPLAIAIAIASGTSPDKGLLTAIIAGFLISALGGSRVQIGGPTGAFIPIVYAVIFRHGYDGLVLATLMAGCILIIAGLLRIGALMKYMPQPLITGFTAGIAVILFLSQLPVLLGLGLENVPAEFVPRLAVIGAGLSRLNPSAVALALLSIGAVVGLRRIAPKAPGFLLVIIAGAVVVQLLGLPVETIGSRFGELPRLVPAPALPAITLARLQELLPDALTIAFLAGVESLLSAVVADGMTGRRHRSNTELVAQGVANFTSALFGGLPATGALARTATNVRAGAVSPVAGIIHAVVLLAFLFLAAPVVRFVPLASLAAVLTVVAFNMSEHERFRHLLSAPKGDRLVLLVTFGLTVFTDLTLAIEVGVVIAALLFMARMANVVEVTSGTRMIDETSEDIIPEPDRHQRYLLPPGAEAFQINGPLFFGVSNRLDDVLDQFAKAPRVFILRTRLVPMIDASGVHALQGLADRCARRGIHLIISGLQPQPRKVLSGMKFRPVPGQISFVGDFGEALELAHSLTASGETPCS